MRSFLSLWLFEFDYCNARLAFTVNAETEAFYVGMASEMLMESCAKSTRALAVNDAQLAEISEDGAVDDLVDLD